MDRDRCENCGTETTGDHEALCPGCKGGVQRKNGKRLRYASVAAAILLLAGAMVVYGGKASWEFSWDDLLDRPAALVNDEPISRSEVRERINVSRLMLEKEYGKGLFAGDQGRALLGRLERDVIEKMVEERLVAKEANRLKIRVDDDRVRREIRKIGLEIYGNWENFQASLNEDGVSLEYLMNHVRNILLRREVQETISPPDADPESHFVAWLARDRRNAKVIFGQTVAPSQAFARGLTACCSSGADDSAGGCGTKQPSGALDPELRSTASAAALDVYRETHPAEKGLEAKVTDYGCHLQVDIAKGGKLVVSYSYRDGKITEI